MPNSLRSRLKNLVYKGILTQKDLDRIVIVPVDGTGDMISRQAAIDTMATWDWQELYLPMHFKQLLEDLPTFSICADVISRQAVLDGLASIAKAKAKSDAQKSMMGRTMFFVEQLPSVSTEKTDVYKQGWHDAITTALKETHSVHTEEGYFRVVQEETLIGVGMAYEQQERINKE